MPWCELYTHSSSLALAAQVLYYQMLVLGFLVAKALQKLFFGPLRFAELEVWHTPHMHTHTYTPPNHYRFCDGRLIPVVPFAFLFAG